ncbi:MAG: cyclopropane fatty acyl phospholipid synthase [Deltaproteobacteria bacterium]|nr:cyclopropane fatty acyl phospholipid synthase [Deltaproteobacteria bacterium]
MSWFGDAESIVRELFARAKVTIDGPERWDIQVHDQRFYGKLLRFGELGFGESYLDGWWDCDALEVLVDKLLRAKLHLELKGNLKMQLGVVKAIATNLQSRKRSTDSARAHYDIGNELYQLMLDRRMQYTCGYFEHTDDLDQAQEAKLELLCKKLQLQPGMKVLELGCGFGGFAIYAAEKYGVEVTGYNVSKAQLKLAREMAGDLPVTFHMADYREATGHYDAVVSVGMMEHIGYKNHRTMLEVVERTMTDEAVAVIHTIGSNRSRLHPEGFVDKYLFPNAVSPSVAQFGRAIDGLLVMEDVHNIGPHYAPTLLAWWKNFEAGYHSLDHSVYDQRFYRLWRYYLLAAAGASSSRKGQLWQWVLTKMGRTQPACRFS